MTLLSRVCCQFCDSDGKPVYTIRREQLLQPLVNVPEEVQEDPLFGWLIRDKKLEVITHPEDLRRAENDPEKVVEKEAEKPAGAKKAEKKAGGS